MGKEDALKDNQIIEFILGGTARQQEVVEEQSPHRTRGRRKEISQQPNIHECITLAHIYGALDHYFVIDFDKEIQSLTRTWLFLRRVHAERAIHTHSSVAQVSQARPILTTRGRPIASSSVAM
ncbi:hypothetical protein ACJX0J_040014, partial [Zea mays]